MNKILIITNIFSQEDFHVATSNLCNVLRKSISKSDKQREAKADKQSESSNKGSKSSKQGEESGKKGDDESNNKGWRMDGFVLPPPPTPSVFNSNVPNSDTLDSVTPPAIDVEPEFQPGLVDFSPAWFMLLREVSILYLILFHRMLRCFFNRSLPILLLFLLSFGLQRVPDFSETSNMPKPS
jgi:hypothetical protein